MTARIHAPRPISALGVRTAFMAARIWAVQVKAMDPSAKYCFLVGCDCDSGNVTLRFHKVRPDEPNWLTDDLEDYQLDAVGYFIA